MTTAKKAFAATKHLSKEQLIELCHFLFGFTDTMPELAKEFVFFRSRLEEWRDVTGKSGIVKDTAVNEFLKMEALERRRLMIEYPDLIILLPDDIRAIFQCIPPTWEPPMTRAFNLERRTELDVYGVFATLKVLTPKGKN